MNEGRRRAKGEGRRVKCEGMQVVRNGDMKEKKTLLF